MRSCLSGARFSIRVRAFDAADNKSGFVTLAAADPPA